MNGLHSTAMGFAFPESFSFGTLEQTLVSDQAIRRLLLACVLGGLIGVEREWKRKSAGVRTNLLICMGCAFFTLLSAVLAGEGNADKGRVASNIVQGIGFLGAGLILHNRSRVTGLASAASIFVVASIGMACGAGLYVPAVLATLVALLALAAVGFLEYRINLKSYSLIYEARGTDETGILMSVLDAMDLEKQQLTEVDRDAIGDLKRITFSVSNNKSGHARLLVRLLAEPAIGALKTYRDPEED